jgi:hypothetical protein
LDRSGYHRRRTHFGDDWIEPLRIQKGLVLRLRPGKPTAGGRILRRR